MRSRPLAPPLARPLAPALARPLAPALARPLAPALARPLAPALALLSLLLLAPGCASTASDRAARRDGASAQQGPRAFAWEVTRADAPERPLVLTGSVHVGQPGQFVLPPSLEAALARAGTLVVELDPDAVDPREVQESMMRLGFLPPPDSLNAYLSPETRRLLPAALARAGLPPAAAERMRPWTLSLTLAVMELQKAGYSDEGGIDRMLLARAKKDGKRVVELETLQEQLQSLAGLPDALQDLMLRDQLRESQQEGAAERAFTEMVRAWKEGDAEALASVVFDEAGDPAYASYYEAIFFQRNRQMADKLELLVGREDAPIAVVGAGHLVGEQGVPALLAAKGFRVRQLPRGD